ncbi:MAG: CRISPR-associated endonuclease Cas1 [Planctomycetota bacterium]
MPEVDTLALLPVRMLNEFVYCPRLFHLMHVEGRWADNVHTLEGKRVHRRVDSFDDLLPDPQAPPSPAATPAKKSVASQPEADVDGDAPPAVSRSVSLSSERLGITAKLDLVSTAGDEAVPVDTKVGSVPDNPDRSWEPERVQLMAQGLLLREHGYACDHGVLYYARSRTRVDIAFTPELEARTLQAIESARAATLRTTLPPPLEDSPKCPGCSLCAICLPDETLALTQVPNDPVAPTVRRLYPARDHSQPLYVQEQGAIVGKTGESLVVRKKGEELARVRLKEVSQVVLCGNVMITAQTVHLLCEAGVPVVYLSMGNHLYGLTTGITLRNAYDRVAQYQVSSDPARRLALAKSIVLAKAANQRTLLRRNADPQPDPVLFAMAQLLDKVPEATDVDQLLGLEGNLASWYFKSFPAMLRPRDLDATFDMAGRNRRPPVDPINAMLSFGYALLAKECTAALLGEGLDPWWGIYHTPRHGRPSLALDLMEEFRPVVVDSAVITAVNTGMVSASDFVRTTSACALTPTGRKAFIRAYEARMDQLVTHPIFDYKCSWRVVIRLQARLLSRWLRGAMPKYEGMVTR